MAITLSFLVAFLAAVARMPSAMGVNFLRVLMSLLQLRAAEETEVEWKENTLFDYTRGPGRPHWLDQRVFAEDPHQLFLLGAGTLKALATRGVNLATVQTVRVLTKPTSVFSTTCYQVETKYGPTWAVDISSPDVVRDTFIIKLTSVKLTDGKKMPWMASGMKYDINWSIVGRKLGVIRATKAPVDSCFVTLRHKSKTPMLTTSEYPGVDRETGSVYSSMYLKKCGGYYFLQWGTSYLSDSTIPPYSGWSLFMKMSNVLTPPGSRNHIGFEEFSVDLRKWLDEVRDSGMVYCLYTDQASLSSGSA